MATPPGICALCEQSGQLQRSHILPAFVFRWQKNTSITGFLRAAENPKKRVQDGAKVELLCKQCEELFSGWEVAFANRVFQPYNQSASEAIVYGAWMLKFCVSISWRVLKFYLTKDGLKDWHPDLQEKARLALNHWQSFLLGKAQHPAAYEQHLLPLGPIESTTNPNLPNNINRYFMRTIDMDVAYTSTEALTFAKLGKLAIFGIIEPTPNRWVGTRVKVKGGSIRPTRYTVPYEIMDYFSYRANKAGAASLAIPDHHYEKIDAKVRENIDVTIQTDEFNALLRDAEMFGDSAVIRK